LLLGILLILFGTVFALQGDGMIGGSAMSNNPFWISAGVTIAGFGVVVAGLGALLGSRPQSDK
jgi:hypothetical protein